MACFDRRFSSITDLSTKVRRYPQKKYDSCWKEAVKKTKAEGRKQPREPHPPRNPSDRQGLRSGCCNALIHPIRDFGLRGAAFLKEESNHYARLRNQYASTFPKLTLDWPTADFTSHEHV